MLNTPPATFTLKDAAEYCGISEHLFKQQCPIKPINFTDSAKGKRWRRVGLDAWLNDIDPNNVSSGRRFGEKAGG